MPRRQPESKGSGVMSRTSLQTGSVDLISASAALEAAERGVASAKANLASDKARRRDEGIWAQAIDFFTSTQAEEALQNAESVLAQHKRQCEAWVRSWHAGRVDALIAQDEDAAQSLSQLRERANSLERVTSQANKLLSLANEAVGSLDRAASACSSASSSELLDAMTSNKAISMMSTFDSSNAKSALERARQAVRRLKEALPTSANVVQGEMSDVDDTLDLIIDFAFDLPLDITSFLQMGSLDRAQQQCKDIEAKITPISAKLREQHAKARAESEDAKVKLATFIQPYKMLAKMDLPSNLVGFV